jgi:hypothetical protein
MNIGSLFYKAVMTMLMSCSFVTGIVSARPPETLDFGFARFVKKQEMLFREPVLHVMINDAGSKPYPYALVLNDRIILLNKAGKQISESPLPAISRIKVRESVDCKYLSLYGHDADSKSAFMRLFSDKGELLFSRDDFQYNDRIPAPLPLAKSRRLLFVDNGTLVLTGFNDDTLASRILLARDSFQDGDIFVAACGRDDHFFAVANRYQFPTREIDDRPTLYHFDSGLNEHSRSTLPYLLINDINPTADGEHLYFSAEQEDGKSPIIISDFEGRALHTFLSSSILRSSSESGAILHIPRSGKPELVDFLERKTPAVIDLPAHRYPWLDAAISADSRYLLFYNDDELALFDTANRRSAKVPFPFSFRRCFISEQGRRIILAGDFGFEIYELSR